MKTNLRFILLIAVIILGVTVLMAQTTTKDVVYLKNGSIIKGIIIEMIPDQTIKIQTADGSVFVYNMSDVEKVSKEVATTSEPTTVYERSEEGSGASFSIFGGVAIPSGEFSKEEGGNAKTGFLAGMQFVTGGTVGWLINGSFSQNKTEIPTSLSSMGISGEAGNWNSILLLTGIKIGTNNSSGTNFFIAPLIGALFGKSPEINLTFTSTIPVWNGYYYEDQIFTMRATQSSASSTALAYGATAELTIGKHLSLGARYIASKPKYNVTTSVSGMGSSMTAGGTAEQSTELILVYLGVVF